jgi:poly(A) polymerase
MKKIIQRELNFNSKNLEFLLNILNRNGETRIIGGAVRDAILGIEKIDIDIATAILPQKIIDILNTNNIKNIPTGINYGTITALIGSESFEITTLRKDVECYGRKAIVEFTDDFEEDALRRDFTMNSLSYDLENKIIYNYNNGYENLINSRLLFIGNPQERIKEDFLRILRFFRFSSNYSNEFDPESLKACAELGCNIKLLSRERITSEFKKIIDSKKYVQAIELMINSQITNYIFQDLKLSFASLERSIKYQVNLIEKIAVLIYKNQPEEILKILKDLRFSNKEVTHIKEIKNFIEYSKKEDLIYSLKYYKLSNNEYIDSFLRVIPIIHEMNDNIYNDLIECYANIKFKALPISGFDIKILGLSGGQIGQAIEKAKHEWIKSNFEISKKDLIAKII